MKYQNYGIPENNTFFSEMKPEEEHVQTVPADAHHEWTETSMFGFNIPEHDIDCIIYFWHHPALRVTTGGIMIWRGNNLNQVECEYSDYRTAMPMPEDQTNCTYANGVSVRMITPLEEFEVTFSDGLRDTHLQLNLRAIMPPACRHNGGHITQAMKTSGKLILNGDSYTIDGFHSRDRSWNECRSEALMPLPPISWSVGIIDETFAFHYLAFDEAKYHPQWQGKLAKLDSTCQWGYVFDNGQLAGVVSTDLQTDVDPKTLRPIKVQNTIQTTAGKEYKLTGYAQATTQIQAWPNMAAHFALMKWEIDGRGIAYGDLQRCMWRDAWRTLIGK